MKRGIRGTCAAVMAAALLASASASASGYLYRHTIGGWPDPASSPAPGPKPPAPAGPAQCALPWGGAIPSGSSVTAYRSPTSPYGISCDFETRACEDGSLGGSFGFQACVVDDPARCVLPWGGTLSHDGKVTAYRTAVVPFGSQCESEARSCDNGILSGSFASQACVVAAPAQCALPWGGTLAHDGTVTAYKDASVPFGGTCGQETRSCTDGSLSGSFTSQSCTVEPAASCSLPWGGTIGHGQKATAYRTSTVPHGSTCEAEERTCSNGALSGGYGFGSCTVEEAPGCGKGTVGWAGPNGRCTGPVEAAPDGTSLTVKATLGAGQANFTCKKGDWVYVSGACLQGW